jgi:phosphoserine phosphatase RsbU/P
MADAEEVLWTDETAPTPDGVDALCRSFAQRLTQLLLPPRIGEDLGRALAGIGTKLAGQPGGATRLHGELKRHKSDLTLTLADDGTPLQRPALQAVTARFPANLYVPRDTQARGKTNRFMIRTGTPEATARPRILVVDDDPVQRLALEMFLRESYAVIACATAAEAELEARLQEPDLIISDIHMPDDDGLAFRDRLAREPALGAVPFLFLTCDRSPGAVAAANETGIDDLIYKPLDKRKLLWVIDRILRRRAQLRALRQISQAPLPAAAWPDSHGRYTIATRRIGAVPGRDGLLLCHRPAADHLQLLICEAGSQGNGDWPRALARQGFIKGAARGIDTALDPAGFLDRLTRLLDEDGLLGESGLAATACRLGAEGTVGLADIGLSHAVLLTAEGAAPFAGTLKPGERLVLTTGPLAGPASPDPFGRPASAIAESLVQDLLARSGGRDVLVCVIGFD